MNAVAREPVVWPWHRAGLRVLEARHARLYVDETGALRATDATGKDRVLARPGEVTRVSHIPADVIKVGRYQPNAMRGLVALWAGSRPVVVLNLFNLLLPASRSGVREALAVSGVDAVAEALGLVVEPATEAEIRTARRWHAGELLPELSPPRYKRWLLLLCLVGLLIAFYVLPASQYPVQGSVSAAVAAGVLAAAVLYRAARVRRLITSLDSPPAAEGRAEFAVDPKWRAIGMMAEARLQVGSDAVVLRLGGSETWVPGPARGGVATCINSGGSLTFRDRHDRVLLAFDQRLFEAQRQAMMTAVRQAGGEYVRESRVDLLDIALSPNYRHLPVCDADEYELDGGLWAGTFLTIALWVLLLGAFLVGAEHPAESPLIVLPIVLLAIQIRTWHRLRSWKRRQLRPLTERS